MCNVCQGREDIGKHNLDIYIIKNILSIDYDAYSSDSSFEEELEINYCPICGRKLEEGD
jgi:hypothetical protein